jgi:O-antigen/teichoic acid export membrane protein
VSNRSGPVPMGGTEKPAAQFEAAQPAEPAPLGVTAARGVGLLVGRTLGLQLLTAGVTVALARILNPADYGLFALALAVQLVGQRAAELGLPSALVRQQREPTVQQQAAIGGVMLIVALLLSTLLFSLAFLITPALDLDSDALDMIAVAGAAMPLYAARAMPMVLMERRLRFGRVALVETADTLAFNGFALGAALAGLGAFSLAGAVPAGGLAGMATAWAVQPFARRPRLDLKPALPLIGFGLQVSLIQGINLLRELGFVGLLAAVGGTPVAGFYAMAKRLFSFPTALTYSVFRVSFPALSRNASLRPGRAARVALYTAIAAGLPLALVAGAAEPLINVVLGGKWLPTVDIVLIGSMGMMLTASANATMISYTLSEGRATSAIIAAAAEAILALAGAALLTVALGEAGVGLALTVSALGATVALAIGTHPLVRRALIGVAKASAIAAAAACAGLLLNAADNLAGILASVAVISAVWLLLEAIVSRADLAQIIRIARTLLRRGASV